MEYFAWAYVILLACARGTSPKSVVSRFSMWPALPTVNFHSDLAIGPSALGSRVHRLRPNPPSTLAGFQPVLADACCAPSVRANNPEGSCGGFRSGLPGQSAPGRAETRSRSIRPLTNPQSNFRRAANSASSLIPGRRQPRPILQCKHRIQVSRPAITSLPSSVSCKQDPQALRSVAHPPDLRHALRTARFGAGQADAVQFVPPHCKQRVGLAGRLLPIRSPPWMQASIFGGRFGRCRDVFLGLRKRSRFPRPDGR